MTATLAFRYRAARPDGASVTGVVEAASLEAATEKVAEAGVFPIELTATPRPEPRLAPPDDVATALTGLAALLDAGLPADRALTALEESAPRSLFATLATARQAVTEGASLSHALGAGGTLPAMVIGMLKAGERTSRLPAAVRRAAEDLERAAETRAKVRAALTYPAFLAAAGTVSVIAIAGFVVPRFAALLDAHGSSLPAATRLLLAASNAVAAFALPVAAVLVVAGSALFRWSRTTGGRLALHRRLLETPLLGSLRLRFATARACDALAGLLDAGVPMLAALDLAAEASGDRALAVRIGTARDDVNRGERPAAALTRAAALSPLALRLAQFGDRSGRLASFLAHAARLEERSAQRRLLRLVALLEPLLILGFGAVVAFVAAALLQAVYSIRPGTGL